MFGVFSQLFFWNTPKKNRGNKNKRNYEYPIEIVGLV